VQILKNSRLIRQVQRLSTHHGMSGARPRPAQRNVSREIVITVPLKAWSVSTYVCMSTFRVPASMPGRVLEEGTLYLDLAASLTSFSMV
jgi:hypothetical protein